MYLVIKYTPTRQGFLGPVPEKFEARDFEVDDLDFFVSTLKVPPGGGLDQGGQGGRRHNYQGQDCQRED